MAPTGRSYYDRKKATGKTSAVARRCLKRRLPDAVYRTLLADLAAPKATGPGGQPGNVSDSGATGSHPDAGSSDKPLHGPARLQPEPAPEGVSTQKRGISGKVPGRRRSRGGLVLELGIGG